MKKLQLALSAAVFCAALVFTGCKNPNGQQVWTDPAFVTKTAFFLKATVANGVVVAVNEDKNAASYCRLAREALAKVRGGNNYTPGAFEAALKQIPVNELKGTYAQLVVANLSLAYELYWSQIVADNINAEAIAVQLIDAAISGIDLGLQGQAPAIPDKPQLTRPMVKRVYFK